MKMVGWTTIMRICKKGSQLVCLYSCSENEKVTCAKAIWLHQLVGGLVIVQSLKSIASNKNKLFNYQLDKWRNDGVHIHPYDGIEYIDPLHVVNYQQYKNMGIKLPQTWKKNQPIVITLK